MEQKPGAKYFRSALGGFDKKDVTEYITKLHMAQRKEIEKYKQFATNLQQAHIQLQAERDALQKQLAERPAAAEPTIVEVPVERYVEVPRYQTLPGEPDEELLAKIKVLEEDAERLGKQINAHIELKATLDEQLSAQRDATLHAQEEAAELREQIKQMTAAMKALEDKTKTSHDAEALAYHRAEAIEREAKYNAAQIRLALEVLLKEAQEVLRGIRAQTMQETTQITVRANQFLEMLSNMPEMLDIVSRQVDAVRPEGVTTPMLLDAFD